MKKPLKSTKAQREAASRYYWRNQTKIRIRRMHHYAKNRGYLREYANARFWYVEAQIDKLPDFKRLRASYKVKEPSLFAVISTTTACVPLGGKTK